MVEDCGCFIDETGVPMMDSALMASCVVSFVDTEGIRHTIEVEAESLFEAALHEGPPPFQHEL